MKRRPIDPTPIDASQVDRLYLDVFSSGNGELVLQDMTDAFHNRLNAELEREVANIDHPFRAYYIDGQRSVVLAVKAMIDQAKQRSS